MTEPITVGEIAEQAAEAIKALIHAASPGGSAPDIEHPSDWYEAFGGLTLMAERLPQLLGLAAGWLENRVHGLEVHGGMFDGDPVAAVATVQAVLADARSTAQALAQDLNNVHNVLATLAPSVD